MLSVKQTAGAGGRAGIRLSTNPICVALPTLVSLPNVSIASFSRVAPPLEARGCAPSSHVTQAPSSSRQPVCANRVESIRTRPLYRENVLRASLDASDASCERTRRAPFLTNPPPSVGGGIAAHVLGQPRVSLSLTANFVAKFRQDEPQISQNFHEFFAARRTPCDL